MLRDLRLLFFALALGCASFAGAAGQESQPKPMQEWTWTWAEVKDSLGLANDEATKFFAAELANETAAPAPPPTTEKAFLAAYAAPDLKAIEAAVETFGGDAKICRDALCIKTDCRATNDAHQKLLLLMGELSALEAWQDKVRLALSEHMSQLEAERNRKEAHREYLDSIREFQAAMHEVANWTTNAFDVIQAVKDGISSPTSLPPKLQLALDATNQALNAVGLLNTVATRMAGYDVHLPEAFQKGSTIFQILTGTKDVIEYSLKTSKGQLLSTDKRLYSVLQLAAKLGMVFSERSINQTKKLVDQYDRLIKVENALNQSFRTEVDRLAALRAATSATRGTVDAAARDFGTCLKSCSAGEVLRNPNPEDDPEWKQVLSTSYSSTQFSETKDHYLQYLRYYRARLKLLARQVATAHAAVSVKSIDPKDPAAPEKCRQLASPGPEADEDPAAGLTRPAIQFPKLALPVRFCSIQEKLDYDKTTLTPVLEEAGKVWSAARHYDSELSIRQQKVKNSLAVLQPENEGANSADSAPASPRIAKLKKQRDRLDQLRRDFAPDLEKAGDEMTSFIATSAAYQKLPVEDCEEEDITPLNIMIPALPETFCSEEEQAEMVAKLEELLKAVRKHREARRNYRQHLYERHAVESDPIIKASLKKEIDDSTVIDAQGDELVSSLSDLLEKAKTLEIGECIDPCLVGSWELRDSPFSGIRVMFKADGTETVDYSASQPWVLSQNPPSTWTLTGKGSARIITPENKTAKYVVAPKSDIKLYIHSKDTPPVELSDRLIAVGLGGTTGDNAYVCTKDTLTYEGSIHRDQRPNFKVKLTHLLE